MVRGVCPCSDADVIRKWNVMIRNAIHIPCMEHDISDLKDGSIFPIAPISNGGFCRLP